jgi:hypothetical protein
MHFIRQFFLAILFFMLPISNAWAADGEDLTEFFTPHEFVPETHIATTYLFHSLQISYYAAHYSCDKCSDSELCRRFNLRFRY